jgi:hypothetical protein
MLRSLAMPVPYARVMIGVVLAIAFSIVPSSAEQQSVEAEWSDTGQDLLEKCASQQTVIAHTCGEYLLGFLDGVVAATPANEQVLCPFDRVSSSQLETAYINWAKANPDQLGRARMLAAAGALSAAFPCPK